MPPEDVTPTPDVTPDANPTPDVPDSGTPSPDDDDASGDSGSATPEEIAAALGNKYKVDKIAAAETPAPADDEPDDKPADTPAEDKPVDKPAPADDEPDDKPADTPAATDEPDFSIEVEDAAGEKYKITSIEDLPEDFDPKNNRQIMEILRDLGKAETDKAAYEAKTAEEKATAETTEKIETIKQGWSDEIKDLTAAGRIPKTTGSEDDNPRVKEVYEFMSAENTKRTAAGKPILGSFEDALDKLENQEARAAKVQAEKDAKETARKNGGMVGGSSAPASGAAPAYRPGSAKNANQALKSMGVL